MSETEKINNVITLVEDNSIDGNIEKEIDNKIDNVDNNVDNNVDMMYNDIVKQKKDDDDETFEYKNRYSFAECIIG